jgi:N-methylhydantoinase A
VRTAAGIVALVNASMAKVLRIVSVERGLDPRDFALMAFGGGGPLHACALAEDLAIARVVVPPHPGLFSAYGLVVAGADATRSRSFVHVLDDASASRASAIASELAAEAAAALHAQDIANPSVATEIDLRYAGQSFELTLAFAQGDDAQRLTARFHAQHEARYGFAAHGDAIEIATVRAVARGGGWESTAAQHEATAAMPATAEGSRAVWDRDAFVSARVVARTALPPGSAIVGPAIVEDDDATTWIPGGWRGDVEAHGYLMLERV